MNSGPIRDRKIPTSASALFLSFARKDSAPTIKPISDNMNESGSARTPNHFSIAGSDWIKNSTTDAAPNTTAAFHRPWI